MMYAHVFGYIKKPIEKRTSKDGRHYFMLNISTKMGEGYYYIDCILRESMETYLALAEVGMMVYVSGDLEIKNFTTQDGRHLSAGRLRGQQIKLIYNQRPEMKGFIHEKQQDEMGWE